MDEDGCFDITTDVCKQLLYGSASGEDVVSDNPVALKDEELRGGLCFVMGYPLVPLYLRLADCFSYWMISG